MIPSRAPFLLVSLSLALACARSSRASQTFLTHSAAEISSALQSAQPGDTILMADGTWTNQSITMSTNGTSALPITLRAQTPGRVFLNGSSKLTISGGYVVADGLRFQDGTMTSGNIVSFTSSSSHGRLTNSAIVDYDAAVSDGYHWVHVDGTQNRIDHTFFKGHKNDGVTLEVYPSVNSQHVFEYNQFVDRPVGSGNGFETIRLGLSSIQDRSAKATIQNNLFERCDGELEVISVKSSDNVIRNNTFRASKGTLTLRHGSGSRVEGNFFLGENVSGTGGIRVIGPDHVVTNNYMQDLDTNALSITTGMDPFQPTEYEPVNNVLISHNTVVNDADQVVTLDAGYSSSTNRNVRPANVTMANNLFYSTRHALFSGTEGPGWTWAGNIASGGSLGLSSRPGISTSNPLLVKDAKGLWRPAGNSPARNGAAVGAWAPATIDMDGQSRGAAPYDVGADEQNGATGPVTNAPLSASDVGPSWLKRRTIALDKFPAPVIVMEAEDYTALRDPNNNGATWNVVPGAGAFGTAILKAPPGPRTDVPGQTHDAIVDYDVAFNDAGTYWLYVLARGPDSGSNSIYSPANLGDSPTVNETLPDDGRWAWVELASYTISASQVNRPITVQIGRRERDVELDMLLFSPVQLSLTVPEPIGITIVPFAAVLCARATLRRSRRRLELC